ncbi:hypothetical protein [Gordonia sp. MMO-8]|uniref:hypothetical protein n=1 Tax=Gordonia sp. MMO-8 TaxID=3127886 RepID=UPI003019C20A
MSGSVLPPPEPSDDKRFEQAKKNGVCPAPITVAGINGDVTFCCELGYDHSGDHLASGLRWKYSLRGAPTITKRLTRKGIL